MKIPKMPRYQSRMAKHPINSLKHVVDFQGGIIGAAAPTIVQLVKGEDNPVVGSNPEQVNIGSHVNAFYLNIQVAAAGSGALANIYFFIAGNPGGLISNASFPNGNVVGTSNLRKMIFHQEMQMTEKNTTAFTRTLFRGVVMVPRKFRRIGAKDLIILSLFSPGVDFDICFQCIYKEYK